MVRFLPLSLFLLLAALCALPLLRGYDPAAIPSAMIGRQAPGLDAHGGPVLVNFFASWCESCRAEQDVLGDIARKEKIAVYGVDYKDRPEALKKFLAGGNPFYKIIRDDSGRLGVDWGITGVPETFVVDGRGVIKYRHAGPVTPDIYEAELRPMLAEAKK